MRQMLLGDIPIPGNCFVIAEAGVNHNGSLPCALKLVDAAVAAKANAVKFQTFKPELLASATAKKAAYQAETTGAAESQLMMLEKLALSYEDFAKIKSYCDQAKIIFLSTPFDYESVDFLDGLGVVAFKIPSGELVNLPFLAHIGAKKRPVILSTGMGSMAEVKDAVEELEAAGCPAMAILQCVSNYPAAASDANLRAMHTLASLGYPVGYSDHTMGSDVALASVALGATVLEKHFTLDKTMAGPDHRCSLEPQELRAFIEGVRNVEASLGSGVKEASASERDTAAVARRSLFLRKPVSAGTPIVSTDLIALRPGDGISPARFREIVGSRPRRDLPAHHKLAMEDLV